MTRALIGVVIACACALAVTTADARPRHKSARHVSAVASQCVYDNSPVVRCSGNAARSQRVAVASDDGAVIVGRRPPGCPHRYCGCEASLYKFGKIYPELNLAANWIRKFPRAQPAPGMAAARNGHVMVLISHVDGDDWLVHDGNSGGGLTRRHVVSIRRYVIVNPDVRMASQ